MFSIIHPALLGKVTHHLNPYYHQGICKKKKKENEVERELAGSLHTMKPLMPAMLRQCLNQLHF